MEKNKIVVIVPGYNPGEFLEKCYSSLITQRYDNFRAIFIDDCSSDGSFDKLPKDDDRIILFKNTIRKTALENLTNVIMDNCEPQEIAVILDADDWLSNKNVLSYINDFYNKHDCWVSWGQSSWTDGRRGFASSYSKEEYLNVRKAPFKVSHLRSWRAGLFQNIKKQDPTFSSMKDKNGNFYRMSYDTAIMFNLLELAPYNKAVFNDTILYIYNRNNPISEDRVNQALQTSVHMEVSNKPKLKQIESYL